MRRGRLPLDGRSYPESVRELERLIRVTPDLSNLPAEECLAADDEKLRVLIRYMILVR